MVREAVEALEALERQTEHLLQLAKKRLERNLARQQELRQQLEDDGIDFGIEQEAVLADDDAVSQTSSSNRDDQQAPTANLHRLTLAADIATGMSSLATSSALSRGQ